MVTAFHPPSTQHINGAQAAKSESRTPLQEMRSWQYRRMSSFRTSPTNRTSSTCWVTTCSLLDASQNTRRRMSTCWLRKQQCNRQLRRTLSSWPTIPIWSSCYATTQIQIASTCSCSVRHGGTTKKNRIWDIKVTQNELGADICSNILFIHAILGCDTTSRRYGLGKGLSLKRFTSSALFRDKAEQFFKKGAIVDDVIDVGEAALVCLYTGKEGDNLDGQRYAKFCNKVATNKVFRLCPRPLQLRDTTACEYTCWYISGWVSAIMKETDWWLMKKDENLVPVMTDLPPAPAIRCNCTTDCSTARCNCRKHSLGCSPACGQCRVIGCSNITAADISDEDDDDDDDDR